MRLEFLIIFVVTVIIPKDSYSKDCSICEKNYQCLSSLKQKDCPNGEFIESCPGCCPGCRGGIITPNDICNNVNKKCAPGLNCEKSSNKCVLNKATCTHTYHLKKYRGLPTCEVDGTFAAVQCKGDKATGRCFCYSKNGDRIYGWAWWRKSKDMTCACSRRKYELNKMGRTDNTLHCDKMGNFESLQCNDGVCWCADPKTGEFVKGTRAVQQSMWSFLPCYDITKMGLQYMRQCESIVYAQHLMKKALTAHGTTKVEFINIQCDFDGAYGTYIVSNGAHCQWRDGTKLEPFKTEANKVSKMNCNCIRDKKIFAEEGFNHRLSCDDNGNYKSVQDINGKLFCVDSDGFAVSDPKETEDKLDCTPYLYYEAKTFGN